VCRFRGVQNRGLDILARQVSSVIMVNILADAVGTSASFCQQFVLVQLKEL
jgi:hypothetical protein